MSRKVLHWFINLVENENKDIQYYSVVKTVESALTPASFIVSERFWDLQFPTIFYLVFENYMHEYNFFHQIYPHSPPSTSLTPHHHVPLPRSCALKKKNSLGSIHVVNMCSGVRPLTETSGTPYIVKTLPLPSLSPSIHQLPIAPQLGVGPHKPLPGLCWDFGWLHLVRVCAYNTATMSSWIFY